MSPDDGAARASRTGFRPGPGAVLLVIGAVAVVGLALASAIAGALGAHRAAAVTGGLALLLVGVGLLAALRVPARSLVVNAPRLRLSRNRARTARRAAGAPEPSTTTGAGAGRPRPAAPAAAGSGVQRGAAGAPSGAVVPRGSRTAEGALTVPGTDLVLPAPSTERELVLADVVTGPVTGALVRTPAARAADERLSGTATGEALARVLQLLAGGAGFLLIALGLASILGRGL